MKLDYAQYDYLRRAEGAYTASAALRKHQVRARKAQQTPAPVSAQANKDIADLDAIAVQYPARVEHDHVDVDSDAAETSAHKLDDSKALQFITAARPGRAAIFTVLSSKTGKRYTYRVGRPKAKFEGDVPEVLFVSYLTGTNNNSDYTYLGMIGRDGAFRLTKASTLNSTSGPVVAFNYVYNGLVAKGTAPGVEIFHEGRCGRCGLRLTTPESVTLGFGPECIGKVGA